MPDRLDEVRALSEAERNMLAVVQRSFQAWLVGLALAESVGIYGLVLTFVARDLTYLPPFLAVALVLLLAKKPDPRTVATHAEEVGACA